MTLPKLRNILLVDTFVLLTIYVIVLAGSSLQWRMLHDSPIVMYISLMIDKFGYVPYRDLLDVNLPGTYLIYALVGRASGYTDLGFRIADLLYLAAIAALTWVWMRDFGKKVAWAGALFGVMLYLSYGQVMSFQREFLILLPLLGALVAAVRVPDRHFTGKYLLIGFLFGFAATIKPQAALAMPFLLAFQAWELWRGEGLERKRFLQMGVATAVGFAIPIGITVIYLWKAGALPSFIEMAQNWWPLNLYITTITTDLQIVTGPVFRKYLLSGYVTGIFTLWLVPMFIGVWFALTSQVSASTKRRVWLLICLAWCYSIYTLLAAKFFPYHWFIYMYFVAQIAALCFVEQPQPARWWKSLAPLVVLWLLVPVLLRPPTEFVSKLLGWEMPAPHNGRVDEIAAFLQTNLQEGETVQPLDWTGGSVHAMLIAKAPIATPVVYDVIFYQNISSPYIQSWRQRFMGLLEAAPPQFIIQIETNKPWITGEDTTREFPALHAFMEAGYTIALAGDGYNVWERDRTD
ncbi:MAG: hypothetical protein KF701_08445 [Anaerolineales bacterium]|nr:MAG: hypothetical protein KF701_08445 [Anaerolineales bacterium]